MGHLLYSWLGITASFVEYSAAFSERKKMRFFLELRREVIRNEML